MAVNCYDCFFLLESNKFNRDPGGVAAALESTIKENGGEILVSRMWEERKLAYPINGQNKGTYWIAYFNMEGNNLTEFNRTCNLDDKIMRHLVTKVDPRLVDTLVAHVSGEAVEEEEEGTDEATDSEAVSTSS